MENLLTRKEAAGLLQISTVTLDKYSKNGLIQKVVMGSVIRFRKEDIQKAFRPAMAESR